MKHRWMVLGALLGALAVVSGAFAAHGLEGRLEPKRLDNWETAARYQMYHALALCLLGLIPAERQRRAFAAAGWLFTAGVVLFCGSLYALALTDLTVLGAVTPFGGLAFITGWAMLAIGSWRDAVG